ncbi:MAG: type II toxin-antitoxin system RelE/ParE family toxin [Planctomycetes bacterium]|nr:type II toxin-antitoxin system RelE/ParE family toxin [Planctomycetota bacterium]
MICKRFFVQVSQSDPFFSGSFIKRGYFYGRIRQGDYRAIYSIDDDNFKVYIIKVGHRKEIYRL